MKFRKQPGYSFDDVLLVPQYSEIASRSDVDISTKLGKLELKLPILSSNMDTITEGKMAVAMGRAGGAGVLHRFVDLETQASWAKECVDSISDGRQPPIIISVGITGEHYSFISEVNPDAICIDVAHADHLRVMNLIQELREDFPDIDIIAGNVATGEGAARLVEAGANIIKVGIGPSSVCTTRIVSGHGVPQLSAILDVYERIKHLEVSIIADGGIRNSGDLVKSFAAGANCIMCGSLLAGTDESPGERIIENGQVYKAFRGMASREVQEQKRPGRTPRVEGISAKVPYRGPVCDILDNLEAGIRSGLSYSGSNTLHELRENAEFLVVTSNTLKE